MTQDGPSSYASTQASSIASTPSRTASPIATRYQKRAPSSSTPTSGPSCASYGRGTFFFPEPSQTLRPGHTYNVSYFGGFNIKADTESNLPPIGITNDVDGEPKDHLLKSIDVPRDTVVYPVTDYYDGDYLASWTALDDCGNTAQNFTWTVPMNLSDLYPNATGVWYKLFYPFDSHLDVHPYEGTFSPKFAIEPQEAPTSTPKPNSGDSSGSNSSAQKGGGGKGLSGGAKAGIAVGVIAAVAVLALLLLKKYKPWAARTQPRWHKPELGANEPKPDRQSPPPVEIDSSPVVHEADGRPMRWEVDGRSSLQNVDESGGFMSRT